jgi:hypothetical protein
MNLMLESELVQPIDSVWKDRLLGILEVLLRHISTIR